MADVKILRSYLEPAMPYLEPIFPYLDDARSYINDTCRHYEAWQIIAFTFSTTLFLVYIWEFLFQEESIWSRIKKSFFRNVRKIPFVKAKIEREMGGMMTSLLATFNSKNVVEQGYVQKLPEKGVPQKQLLEDLQKYKNLVDVDWSKGSCSGTVYNGDHQLTELMSKVYGEFAWSNPLHADVFPDIRKMEAEVVRMTCTMFNGSPDSCGSMTSGGTESIMLACRAYRDRAMDKGIKYPEMIVPHTVHAAFDKAAQYFRMKITHIPVNEKTRQVDVRAMKRAINSSTCMLVGSAPSFPHGIIDPISEISKLGVAYGIPVHVDSCLGGFLLPFMGDAGFPLEPFDFRLPGVTSISADTHKFGFAPKGSSVVMYSKNEYRVWQYFVAPDWTGGIYASPTFAGSRAGAIIAACWATMMHFGRDGYVETTQKIIQTTRHITEQLRDVDGLRVFGEPKVCVVGLGSDKFNPYRLSDALSKCGWNLNALQFPSSVHLCVTMLHTNPGVADRFVEDVRRETAEIMKDPTAACGGQGAMYGMAQSIPDRSLVSEIATAFFDAYYNTKLPAVQNGTSH